MAKKKISKRASYEHYHFIKWILILAGIAVFGFLFLKIVNFFIPKDGLVKPPEDTNQNEYVSEDYGYSISYPDNWTIDTSRGVPADIIKNPSDTVNIAIQRLVGDARLLKSMGITPVMKEMLDSYKRDKNYTPYFLDGVDWKGLPRFQAKGKFNENGVEWNFEENSIFFGSEIYNLRANWKDEGEGEMVPEIISSFRINGYDARESDDANKAMAMVMDLSEARKFQSDVFSNNQSKFSVYVDGSPTESEPYYIVVVAEFFPDHRTTFNRYRVDIKNKVEYRYDVVNDSWDKIP